MHLRRFLFPIIAVGVVLLLVSLVFVGRDLKLARSEAEEQIVALAETGALAIQFVPANEVESYLSGLLQHPAVEVATVYSGDGKRTIRSRPSGPESPLIRRVIPSLGEPVVGCKAVGSSSLCVQADMTYFRRRLAGLVVPHAILLAASMLLLLVAVVLGRGSHRKQLTEITRIVRGASEESNYAIRAAEAGGEVGRLSDAVNKLLEQMQQRDLILRRRTTELESANRELEAFTYAVSHDLRNPIASLDGFAEALREGYGDRLDETGKEYLAWIGDAVEQMKNLVAGLLQMSRVSRVEINRSRVDLSQIARSIAGSLQQRDPSRSVEFQIESDLVVNGDERLLHAVLENLMSNAFKFTGRKSHAVIAFGATTEGGRRAFFVRDNGAGFDSTGAAKMFTPFQRLHSSSEFEGTGIGLSTVKRIIERHGGSIWADGQVGEGATFFFTIGDAAEAAENVDKPELTRA